jgi:hypothetical protein
MNVFVRHLVLILFMWLMLAGVCLGKQVYLKDGGIIDSQSAWRKGGTVFVKVNRDIIAEFNPGEIDLRRTFPKTGSSSRPQHRKAAAGAVATPVEQSSVPAKAAPAPAVATPAPKPAVPPTPAVATPAPKPVTPPAPAATATEPPQPTATAAAPSDSASPPDKAELERRKQEAVKMMTEAMLKKDPDLMKKALEMQKSAMPQQGSASQQKSGFPISILLAFLAACILIIAGQWIVFQKAGQAGWKSLIPFYNMYVLMEISGKPGWWMFLLFVPLVGIVIYLFAMLSLAKKFRRSELFGVGLVFLPMIFFPVLAFGGSEYEG